MDIEHLMLSSDAQSDYEDLYDENGKRAFKALPLLLVAEIVKLMVEEINSQLDRTGAIVPANCEDWARLLTMKRRESNPNAPLIYPRDVYDVLTKFDHPDAELILRSGAIGLIVPARGPQNRALKDRIDALGLKPRYRATKRQASPISESDLPIPAVTGNEVLDESNRAIYETMADQYRTNRAHRKTAVRITSATRKASWEERRVTDELTDTRKQLQLGTGSSPSLKKLT